MQICSINCRITAHGAVIGRIRVVSRINEWVQDRGCPLKIAANIQRFYHKAQSIFTQLHRKLSRLVCQATISPSRYHMGLGVYKVVSLQDPDFTQLHLIATYPTLFNLQNASGNLEYVQL